MATIQEAIDGYIKLRDKVDEIRKRQSEELKPLRENMKTLEAWFLRELDQQGAKSIAAESGTAFKSTKTSSKVEDWEATLQFIRSNELWHMLERRVAKTAVEEYLEANGELPPGVAVNREVVVQVRRKS
jgi:hypothetical protein